MNELRSLADQLRSQISAPDIPNLVKPKKATGKAKATQAADNPNPRILADIKAYNNTDHKNMVHVRFDASTARLLNHFKMATNVDVTKLVAFSVHELFKNHPELKTIIKQFIQKLEL